jgi:penicillin-binding protein 2
MRCQLARFAWLPLVFVLHSGCLAVEGNAPEADGATTPIPSWETQRQAAAYVLSIPAPRGQIVDRNGEAFAVNRVSYDLSISFPTPLTFTDPQIREFAQKQAEVARSLTRRPISFSDDAVVQHYRNRGMIPFDIATDLPPNEVESLKNRLPSELVLRPIYVRTYPQGATAGHVIGYTGKTGRLSTKTIQNNEPLWPESEGREGLEQTFDDQLRGKPGQVDLTFNRDGRKTGERITVPPEPGYNVVTTLDLRIQQLAERILQKRAKRGGAIVVLDPNSGEILALASWPTINPNDFVPSISEQKFAALEKDPTLPLLPRAYRSAYPAGSTFKVIMGVSAFQSKKIDPDDEFDCSSAMQIGNLVFHNWRKSDQGDLTFPEALTQSCNTWFYQLGLKLGADIMVTWAERLGLGKRTGLLLNGEAEGRIPTNDYMLATYHRRFAPGDLANFAIGQGDILISPLQMAQAMATIGNGGTLYQTRIVRQIQSVDNEVVYSYAPRAKDMLHLNPVTMQEIRQGMVGVVSGRGGTAGSASVEGVKVAGKTGTAQWGPKSKERTAAWFAGFAPAESPKYAYAAVYEGAVGEGVHGGTAAAPMIGELLRELFKNDPSVRKDKDKEKERTKKPDREEQQDEDTPDTMDESD